MSLFYLTFSFSTFNTCFLLHHVIFFVVWGFLYLVLLFCYIKNCYIFPFRHDNSYFVNIYFFSRTCIYKNFPSTQAYFFPVIYELTYISIFLEILLFFSASCDAFPFKTYDSSPMWIFYFMRFLYLSCGYIREIDS